MYMLEGLWGSIHLLGATTSLKVRFIKKHFILSSVVTLYMAHCIYNMQVRMYYDCII